MILCISINLVKFCVSEVGEFWWRFFYFAWRMKGDGERGVVDGICCPRLSCTLIEIHYKLIKISSSASLYMSRKTRIKKIVLYRMLLTFDIPCSTHLPAAPTYQQAKKKFPHTNCYFSTPSQRGTRNTKNKLIAVSRFRIDCNLISSWSFDCTTCTGACDR
jgi:hypothetical protein